MWYVAVALGSFTLGVCAAALPIFCLRRRLVARLTSKAGLLAVCRELENRRVGYDSGRDHLARSRSGRPARVSDGLDTKNGSLAQFHAQRSNGSM